MVGYENKMKKKLNKDDYLVMVLSHSLSSSLNLTAHNILSSVCSTCSTVHCVDVGAEQSSVFAVCTIVRGVEESGVYMLSW